MSCAPGSSIPPTTASGRRYGASARVAAASSRSTSARTPTAATSSASSCSSPGRAKVRNGARRQHRVVAQPLRRRLEEGPAGGGQPLVHRTAVVLEEHRRGATGGVQGQLRLLLRDHDRAAVASEAVRRRETGDAATDDDHVAAPGQLGLARHHGRERIGGAHGVGTVQV